MDVLREAWEGLRSPETCSILAHVLKMRDMMEEMAELVRTNLGQPSATQAIIPAGLFQESLGFTTVVEHSIPLKDTALVKAADVPGA